MQCTLHLVVLLALAALATAEIRNKGWWKDMTFYQIYPRSFMDSDGNGVGDLQGITSKLEHFVDAGIGAIWLSPINRSPMVDFGYDISDFRDVDPAFGKFSDLTVLIKRAKELGLKVILDLVPNHTSDEHYWFEQSVKGVGKYKDYYIWANGKNNNKEPPNNWISVFGGPAWTFNPTRNQWYFHQFHLKQPDLNYNNVDVQEEMREIIEFWLRKGMDGFRIDAVPHLFEDSITKDEPKTNLPGVDPTEYKYLNHIYTKDHPKTYELVQSWRYVLDNYSDARNEDEKVMMTEAYTSLENTTRFYGAGAHVPFNFKFIMEVNASSSAADFKGIIDGWMSSMPKTSVANWVMGNHDRSRVATRYPGRPDQMTMLAMILPGVAVTYNGEEIGMVDKTDISFEDTQDPQGCNAGKEKYKTQSRDPCRTPFQWSAEAHAGFSNTTKTTWLPVNTNYKTLNLAKEKTDKESHYKVYQALTTMRKTSTALKNGTVKAVVLEQQVLGVVRTGSNETVTLLINFNNSTAKTVDLSKEVKNGMTKVKIQSVGANLNMTAPVNLAKVTVPAKASIVLSTTPSAKSGAMAMLADPVKLVCVFAFMLMLRS